MLFWREGFDGDDILDPMLWAKIKCLWNANYGLDVLVVNVNLSATLIDLCDQIDSGYHYLFTDYPYNFTNFQDFTMEEIERRNMCEDITITTVIKESSIKSGCVSASELQNTIIWIFVGIAVGIFLLGVIVSVVVYCLVCRKVGCQVWCKDKCCECCCKCKCCTRKNEDYDGTTEAELLPIND